MQCCACSKWVHLRCSQLSLSNFRALGSSHSWRCPPCHNTVTPPSSDSSGTYTSTVESGPPSANAAPLPHPRRQTSYPPSAHLISPSPALPPPSLAPGYTSAPPASSSPPDSLRVLQWNAGDLRARSTELLHFLSSHPVDLICIQESNLNSSSSFRIPGFSVLIVPTPDLASSLLMPRMPVAALSFSSDRAYPFLNFLPSLFLRSIPTLIM